MFVRARRQLTLVYASTGILLFALLALGIMFTLITLLDREIDRDIEHVLDESADMVSRDASTPLALPIAFGPAFLFAFSPQGEIISNPRDLPVYQVVPAIDIRRAAMSGEDVRLTRAVRGERYRLHFQPVIEGNKTVGVIVAGRSLARRDDEVHILTFTMLASGAVWAVLASVAAYVIAGRALRPVRDAYTLQEEFVAGAAHELRSPIGVIRAASEVGLRGEAPPAVRELLTEVNSVAREASELVETLLDLARMRPHGEGEDAESDLAEVAGRELSRMELVLSEHDMGVIDDLGSVRVRVSEADVARVVRALIENVSQHTPPGTRVFVRTREAGGFGELTVEDNGPGIPPDQLKTIFAPFARGDEARRRSRGGSGLGLAIVQRIATHHGGSVRARLPVGGRGLVLVVSFPVA
ncbi:MAG: HAMP domain-containing sensor histidine kinase [Dehalococcoidia bacterium]